MANDDWKQFSTNPLTSASSDCASCASNQFEAKQREDKFFMECPSCGKRGPEAASVYEAQVGWQRMLGRSPLGMTDMTRVVVISLLLVGVGLLILNAILG